MTERLFIKLRGTLKEKVVWVLAMPFCCSKLFLDSLNLQSAPYLVLETIEK